MFISPKQKRIIVSFSPLSTSITKKINVFSFWNTFSSNFPVTSSSEIVNGKPNYPISSCLLCLVLSNIANLIPCKPVFLDKTVY